MCNESTNRCEDWSLWWGWQRSRCAELICWKTHSVIQCCRWELKRPRCKISTSKWTHERFNKKYTGLFHFWYGYSCSPRLQRFSLPQLPTGWRLIDQLNLWIRCDAIPSVPNRIRMERYLEIASDRQLGPLHFSSSILLRTGGGCFTKIETVLVKVRRAPESIMWYSWGRPLFEAKKRQLDSMASGFEGGHPPPSEPRNFIFIQVWRNQSFGWLESCQIHSWKGIPKIWVTSQVRCLQSAKWMEHHKKT